jgi:hypothetical protein
MMLLGEVRELRTGGAALVPSALIRAHRLPPPARSGRRGLRPRLMRRWTSPSSWGLNLYV